MFFGWCFFWGETLEIYLKCSNIYIYIYNVRLLYPMIDDSTLGFLWIWSNLINFVQTTGGKSKHISIAVHKITILLGILSTSIPPPAARWGPTSLASIAWPVEMSTNRFALGNQERNDVTMSKKERLVNLLWCNIMDISNVLGILGLRCNIHYRFSPFLYESIGNKFTP